MGSLPGDAGCIGTSTRQAPARARKTSSYSDEYVRAQSGHWKYRTVLPAVAQLVIVTWQCMHSTESI